MSLQARESLAAQLIYQDSTQKSDLLNESLTQTGLIALLLELLGKGFHLEITAVRTDHSNDAYLGLHSHANGYCVDCWPLNSETAGDYMDQNDPKFQAFLSAAAQSVWCYQIGLGGAAQTDANYAAIGEKGFTDNGADHVHLGAE